jgi:integrase
MASVLNLPNGRRAVQFFAPDGERRTIRLGKLSKDAAAEFGRSVDVLVDAKNAGQQAPRKVLEWAKGLSDDLTDRLAKFGVIEPRRKAVSVALGPFIDDYTGKRTDVKSGTAVGFKHVRRCLVKYFGTDRAVDEITPGDADEWRLWLRNHEKLSSNTIARRCATAKQFFRAAFRKKLIPENPFDGMKGCLVKENRTRDYFITMEEAGAVLEACPDAQWRLLFALSRFGGLRCPSEHLGLRWSDVDWERNRITIHSPKTEHHEGKDSRVIPVFPELRPYLEEVWEQAEPGAEYVITRYRSQVNCYPPPNLGTELGRIIRRAGLTPWPKIWQNLRATRETELAESYPMHVVCAWIGNSQVVAKKHYLQVTDAHFQKAVDGGCSALQNALHQHATTGSNETHEIKGFPVEHNIPGVLHCF